MVTFFLEGKAGWIKQVRIPAISFNSLRLSGIEAWNGYINVSIISEVVYLSFYSSFAIGHYEEVFKSY